MLPYGDVPIRVFLLDDHDLVRRGIRDLLAAARDIVVAGEADSVLRAPEQIIRLDVDVMLLDLHLQDGSGIEVCRRVRASNPEVKGLLLTAAADDEAASASVLAGAAGYTTKHSRGSDIIGSIRTVHAGQQVADAAAVQEATDRLLTRARTSRPPFGKDNVHVLELVAAGLTDRDIAQRLGAPLSKVVPQVLALVERLSADSPHGSDLPSAGRHRRPTG